MEMDQGDDDHNKPLTILPIDSVEGLLQEFLCNICWKLLYKPVVLECGHALCFWCLFKTMHAKCALPTAPIPHRCPYCTHPYWHLPSICQLFHLLLLKTFPTMYEQRRKMVLEEEEKSRGWFTPAIEDSFNQLSCSSCEELVLQPVVLNCGHVYCLSCLDRADGSLNCQVCQSPNPGEFTKVCPQLDQLLEKNFSEEYLVRQAQLKSKLENCQKGKIAGGKIIGEKKRGEKDSKTCTTLGYVGPVIEEAGCDSCGMYPIIGEWYRCIDCTDEMGYDVCGSCYYRMAGGTWSEAKLLGRFNQKHKLEHRLKLVDKDNIRDIRRND